jgi:Domain of unknown function (DUF1772)
MREVIKTLATLCCGVFFGAALYISLVQHPAALEAGNDFAARFFPPMYGRAAVMQASLAVIGCVAAFVAWLTGAGRLWLAAAVLLGSVVPFTLVAMKPVNDALLQGTDASTVELDALLVRWGYLHWARTVASGLAFVTCLVATVQRARGRSS